MQEKIKKFSKKYLIGIILGIFVFGIGGVYAATYIASNRITYDHSTSGMSATEVQGAIDELYNTCFPPIIDQIIDSLEKDPYECRYFFTGANPNNYITFNGEKAGWRIISAECDGTIKIMRDEDINTYDNLAWDTSNSNNWNRPATLNTYLNSTYYNSLTSTAQSQIVSHEWSVGAVTYANNDLADQINDENSKKWKGKVALPTLSEYIRANSNKERCGTLSLNNSNYSTCRTSDWMFDSSVDYLWTLSPFSGNSSGVLPVNHYGNVDYHYASYTNFAVRPAITLSSEVQITGGTGTQSDPYTLG